MTYLSAAMQYAAYLLKDIYILVIVGAAVITVITGITASLFAAYISGRRSSGISFGIDRGGSDRDRANKGRGGSDRSSVSSALSVKHIVDGIMTVLIFLPPAVLGISLTSVLRTGLHTAVPMYFFSPYWVISDMLLCSMVAGFVVSFPIFYVIARLGFERVDGNTILAARTLGMSRGAICRNVILPQAKRSIVTGIFIVFMRAAAESSAWLFVYTSGYLAALIWVLVLVAAGIILAGIVNAVASIIK